jgi:hypothetical protein
VSKPFKFLRIAFSAFCGLACVLLVVLWVRSYWRIDWVEGNLVGQQIAMVAAQGNLRLDVRHRKPPRWLWRSEIIATETIGINPGREGRSFSCRFFNLSTSATRTFAWMPVWIPALLTAALAAAAWLSWPQRFSLRTLLAAMTVVAVAIGAIVAVSG